MEHAWNGCSQSLSIPAAGQKDRRLWERECSSIYSFVHLSVCPSLRPSFEKLFYEQIYNYLIKNNLLDSRQSGFSYSTVTALLALTNLWCFNIDRELVSGILFLDLKKAFDTVDHQLLLTKLEYLGIRDHALEWFKSCSKQISIVFTNGLLSNKAVLRCGVPQGSILGPLLFLIYISDLTTIIYHLLYGYNSTRALIGCWAGIISCNDGASWIFFSARRPFCACFTHTFKWWRHCVISWPAIPRTIYIIKSHIHGGKLW